MSEQFNILVSSALHRQPVLEKKNSDFVTAFIRVKIDLHMLPWGRDKVNLFSDTEEHKCIYPGPTPEQDKTKGKYLKESLTDWNSEFSFFLDRLPWQG